MTETSYDVLLRILTELGPTAMMLSPEKLAARLRDGIAAWDAARTESRGNSFEWGVQFEHEDFSGIWKTETIRFDPEIHTDPHQSALDAVANGYPSNGRSHRAVCRVVTAWAAVPLPLTPPPHTPAGI